MGKSFVVKSPVGVGFGGLLTIVFVTLKLLGEIDWSWRWVVSPLWIPLAVIGVIVAFCLALAAIGAVIDRAIRWRQRRKEGRRCQQD